MMSRPSSLPVTALTLFLIVVATLFALAPDVSATPRPTAAQSENQQSFKEGCDLLGGESFEGSYMEDGNLITYNLCLDNGPDGDGTTIYCESTRSGAVSCYSDRHGVLIVAQDPDFQGPTDTLAPDPPPTPTPVVTGNARD